MASIMHPRISGHSGKSILLGIFKSHRVSIDLDHAASRDKNHKYQVCLMVLLSTYWCYLSNSRQQQLDIWFCISNFTHSFLIEECEIIQTFAESKTVKRRRRTGSKARRFFYDRLIEAILAFLPGITSGGSSIPLNERFFAGAIYRLRGRSRADYRETRNASFLFLEPLFC